MRHVALAVVGDDRLFKHFVERLSLEVIGAGPARYTRDDGSAKIALSDRVSKRSGHRRR